MSFPSHTAFREASSGRSSARAREWQRGNASDALERALPVHDLRMLLREYVGAPESAPLGPALQPHAREAAVIQARMDQARRQEVEELWVSRRLARDFRASSYNPWVRSIDAAHESIKRAACVDPDILRHDRTLINMWTTLVHPQLSTRPRHPHIGMRGEWGLHPRLAQNEGDYTRGVYLNSPYLLRNVYFSWDALPWGTILQSVHSLHAVLSVFDRRHDQYGKETMPLYADFMIGWSSTHRWVDHAVAGRLPHQLPPARRDHLMATLIKAFKLDHSLVKRLHRREQQVDDEFEPRFAELHARTRELEVAAGAHAGELEAAADVAQYKWQELRDERIEAKRLLEESCHEERCRLYDEVDRAFLLA